MQIPPFTPSVKLSRYLKPLLLNEDYAARYAECVAHATTWKKTQLQLVYKHEYNSLRSRRASGKPFDPRLRDIRNWLIHVGPRPAEGWSLDEVVRGRGYRPDNCRWALRSGLQLENRKVTKWHLMPDGQKLLTRQFAKRLQISPNALRKQLRKGRTAQQLLDKYQQNRGLHAWEFPSNLVHVLEPLYQRRTRYTQPRIEWFIHYLEKQIQLRWLTLSTEERRTLEDALSTAVEQRESIIRELEETEAQVLSRIVAALTPVQVQASGQTGVPPGGQ